MAKQKSRRIIKKRFKITSNGKIKRKAVNASHLNRKQDSSTRHRKKRTLEVTGKYQKKIKKMIVK